MSRLTISAASTEYVLIEVRHTVGGVATDPTTNYTPHVAFLAYGVVPASSFADDMWHAATWQTSGGKYFARCLVGPKNSGVDVDAGDYRVWLGLDGPIEEPVLEVAEMTVV